MIKRKGFLFLTNHAVHIQKVVSGFHFEPLVELQAQLCLKAIAYRSSREIADIGFGRVGVIVRI